jgi:hypothetical protein
MRAASLFFYLFMSGWYCPARYLSRSEIFESFKIQLGEMHPRRTIRLVFSAKPDACGNEHGVQLDQAQQQAHCE